MEISGHPLGMLDRDQRTAKLRICKCLVLLRQSTAETNQNTPVSQCSFPRRTCSHCSHMDTWKSGYFWTSFQKLKHVLIVGVYLTLIAFPARTLAAPANIKMSSRFDQQPKWINPCGLTTLKSAHPNLPHESPNSTPDSEMFQPIITQAEIALDKANKIKDQFVTTTFQRSFDEINNWFSNSIEDEHYDEWLPKFPKKIGENVPESILQDMEVDNALLEAYTNLQMVALGLEQVVWDQIDRDGQFKAALGEAEHNLRSVLCELQMTISERNLQMKEDVTREHMSGKFRKMDVTKTKQRDFIIFREYINALEYVIKVFDYLQNRKID